jgi:hypothetical protein
MSEVIAKESGHWYDINGNPAYEVANKSNGAMRPTTLRDAKKLNLFPSVTTIMRIKAAPGLEIWKQNNILQAAATLPHIEGESVDDWCKRVIEDANEQGKRARDKGTEIHGAIERFYLDGSDTTYGNEVMAVDKLLKSLSISPVAAEKSFSHSLGYGGKIDFIGADHNGLPVVIDFKTTEFKEKKKLHWAEMVIQLAAYAKGLELDVTPRLINIFISTDKAEPQVDFYEWSEVEKANGWRQFELLLELWQIEKGYTPQPVTGFCDKCQVKVEGDICPTCGNDKLLPF